MISLARLRTAIVVCQLGAQYGLFAVLKRFVPITTLARLAWRDPCQARDLATERQFVARVIRARRLFAIGDHACLQNGLVLYRGLARAGANPILIAGFRRSGRGLEGHASVVVDGAAIGETALDVATFLPTLHFGAGGALLSGVNGSATPRVPAE